MAKDMLKAGVAGADITPQELHELGGGAFGIAREHMHPLKARVLYLSDGSRQTIVAVCDVLGFERPDAWQIRARIGNAVNAPAGAVMLIGTHTHCAPATLTLRNWGTKVEPFLQQLGNTLVELAQQAKQDAQPAKLAAGRTQVAGLAVNRCLTPDGPVDDALRVVSLRTADDNPLAVLMSFSVHPVSLHSCGAYTPDFPHYIAEQVGEQTGAETLFVMGAGGDTLPATFENQTPDDAKAQAVAKALADAALDILPTLTYTDTPAIDYASMDADLPLQPLPTADELKSTIAENEAALRDMGEGSPTDWKWTGRKTRLEWARAALAEVEAGRSQAGRKIEVQALRLGDAMLLGIPGEPFAAWGQRVEDAAEQPHVITASMANGCDGYLATDESWDSAPYEAAASARFLGIYAYARGAAERLAETAINLLHQFQPHIRNRKSRDMWEQACNVVVGGGQKHKQPVKYMQRGGPAFITSAQGAYFRDVDGNRYLDYLLGYGPILLGHADPVINEAVQRQMQDGTVYSLEHPRSVELAERLIEHIPSADKVLYFVGGSSATLGAIRCARAHTGRERILRCGYHGWFDWCWAGTPGVPKAEKQLITDLPYNDAAVLQQTLEANPGQIAGVIIESIQGDGPSPGYFDNVRKLCDEHGVVFILDEVKTGFRFDLGGAQKVFNIDCDLSTFGKAMCNGYPGAVLVGKEAFMGPRTDAYTAATFHADMCSLTAALTVIEEMQRRDGITYLHRLGQKLRDGLNDVFQQAGYPCHVTGYAAMPQLLENKPDAAMNPVPPHLQGRAMSEFFGAMQRRGVFMTGHCWFLSLAHTDADIEWTLDMAREAIGEAQELLSRMCPAPQVATPA